MTEEKAIVYLRVSTGTQEEKDQLPSCMDYCRKRRYVVLKVFKNKVSAWKKNVERKELDKCFNYAKHHGIKHIVFWSMSRLYRQRKRCVETIKYYHTKGFELHFVKQGFLDSIHSFPPPWNDALFDFLVQVYADLAENESKEKSERVRKAHRYGDHENWGRPSVPYTDEEIYQAYQKHGSLRKASEHLPYRCKNRKKKYVSRTTIGKVVKKCQKKQTPELAEN